MSETRKIAAILAADVVGFSRLTGADEDRTLARLRALRSDLMDPMIAVHRGRVVKRTTGSSRSSARGRRRALRDPSAARHGLAQRRRRATTASSSASASISATSSRRPTAI
jgi:adenylate cyclase